jgi:hypothetical protein
MYSSFIGSTPLRAIITRRIIFSTIVQNIGEEIVTKSEELMHHIGDNLLSGDEITLHFDNLNCSIMTALLFIFASYHNFNMVYGTDKKLYMDSFAKNAKLFIMILFFIFTKNVESAL